MGSSKDSAQAQHALVDPLIEPDPSDETGLNTHFASTFAPRQQLPTPPGSAKLQRDPSAYIPHQRTGSSVETNPYRRSRASSVSKGPSVISHSESTPKQRRHEHPDDHPSPPHSAGPSRSHFPTHRSEAFQSLNDGRRPRRSSQPSSVNVNPFKDDGGLTRGGSLRERYPGDNSHRPLETIRNDIKAAHRAHHLRKKNFQGADAIDRLDKSGFSYHHEGPYDAANLARNTSWKHSPVAATKDSNEEALRATPRENIMDAISRHRPIEGVANYPPGVPDKLGRVLDYEEGADLQREPGGDYRRWPGVDYHPDDLKGKGEPSFTIDKALKDHKAYGDSGTEMQCRRRTEGLGAAETPETIALQPGFDRDDGVDRSNTSGRGVGSALRKRFGSLRRKKVEA